MRILVYSLNYAPELTSTGKYTGEMAAWLAARGHEVHVIAPPPHYPQWQVDEAYRGRGFHMEMLEGVKVFRTPLYVPRPERVSARRRIAYEMSFCMAVLARWLPRWISLHRYDVVIAVCPPVQLGLWPWCYQMFRRVPWVFHIQDLQVDAAYRLGMLRDGPFVRCLYRTEGFLLRQASAISTITEPMRRRIMERGVPGDRIWLTPNWANLELIEPGPSDNVFRRQLQVGTDRVLVMYAGNVGVKQGLEVVLDTADRLRNESRVHFALIGSGAASGLLEAKAKQLNLPNLTMLPVQPREKLATMLGAADVHLVVQKRAAADLVMPSKLTNILAAGRPAIATADAGTALEHVLSAYDAGLVCEPDDPDALGHAIQTLLDRPDRRRQMGYNARRYATEQLNQDVILEAFEAKLGRLTFPNRANLEPGR